MYGLLEWVKKLANEMMFFIFPSNLNYSEILSNVLISNLFFPVKSQAHKHLAHMLIAKN